MKKRTRRTPAGLRRKGDTNELAASLAPLEELTEHAQASTSQGTSGLVTQENGAIVVGSRKLTLPKDVVEVETRRAIEPVVIVIAALLLAYVLFIAWQISQMP